MKKLVFQGAKYVKSATHPKDFPRLCYDSGEELPEVAVVGRSNVGKSSLLNHLFDQKNLVKTSSTPGKTQAIQFFSVSNSWSFVDLPGYGYAKVPVSIRKQWGPMIERYLKTCRQLKQILFLLDIRRTPSEEDLQFFDWAHFSQVPLILVLTKVDKVNQSKKILNTRKILEVLETKENHFPYVHYSTVSGRGKRELIAHIQKGM